MDPSQQRVLTLLHTEISALMQEMDELRTLIDEAAGPMLRRYSEANESMDRLTGQASELIRDVVRRGARAKDLMACGMEQDVAREAVRRAKAVEAAEEGDLGALLAIMRKL